MLASYPTQLEYCPRLSLDLRREIFIKRDDELGPGLGGNKTRKLEYLLAAASRQKFRKVVTFGGLQSNHVRITAAAARKLDLETHIFYFARRPEQLTGNLLLNHLLGAKMHFIPIGGRSGGGMTIDFTIRLVRLIAWSIVGPHYFIPVGGHSWLGCLGYASAALEIDSQAQARGIPNSHLVVAAGSGGTVAGLMAGLHLLQSPVQLLGIDVGKLWKSFPISIARIATEVCTRLASPHLFFPEAVPLVENKYVGAGYGKPSPEGNKAMKKLARSEGILLDPIYTAKAFAGMLHLIERKNPSLGHNDPLIFLHTGGTPALFA